jgi:hypothetical protein
VCHPIRLKGLTAIEESRLGKFGVGWQKCIVNGDWAKGKESREKKKEAGNPLGTSKDG